MELKFLTDTLAKAYGTACDQIIMGLSCVRKTTFRVNTLKSSPDRVEAALAQAGLRYDRTAGLPDAYEMPGGSEEALRTLSVYDQGEIYLQSLSSMLPPLFVMPREGEDILDMAAAPGGKTSQLCQMTAGRGNITACEVNRIRAERMRSNLKKLGCTRVQVLEQDARKLDSFFRFDRILLDAPCSGSGTLDLNSESSCRAFSEKLVHNSSKLQRELFRKAAQMLKPGGTLVYSTCSLLPEENSGSIADAKRLGLTLQPIPEAELPEGIRLLDGQVPGTVTVCPDERFEGFFMARFLKTGK